MSLILAFVMLIIALLVVLVLAASASFPRHVLPDDLSPEGEWSGPARLPQVSRGQSPIGRRPGQVPAQPLKVHSWI